MKTNEIIAGLRKLSRQGSNYRRTVCRQAADALEAAIADLKEADPDCVFCEHSQQDAPCAGTLPNCNVCTEACGCKTCWDCNNWTWRGV